MALGGEKDEEFVTPDSPKFPRVLLSKSLADMTEHIGGPGLTFFNGQNNVSRTFDQVKP